MIAFSVLCDGAIRLTEYVIHFSGFDESKAGSRLQASAGESVSRQKKLASV
ncbi:hypothetical protein [Bacillus paralicheniformis]|uniref:hypothetical protein n=1 Tax=Bacillus paralicheniformis TaxID=1648923 RepID=UPI001319D26A|nr:hypothetical protein [Bacillus paralicheniformis]